jgi:hypothetical protein
MKLPAIFRKDASASATGGPWVPGELPALPAAVPAPAPRPANRAPPGELPPLPEFRKRLVFGFDATASRSQAWPVSKR